MQPSTRSAEPHLSEARTFGTAIVELDVMPSLSSCSLRPVVTTLLIALGTSACDAGGDFDGIMASGYPSDGRSMGVEDGLPRLMLDCAADCSSLRADDVGLLLWPDGEDVTHTTSLEPWPQPDSPNPRFTVSPDSQLGKRWYALRWTPPPYPPPDRIDGGVRIIGGDRLWRFFGQSVPELDSIHVEGGELVVYFTENLQLRDAAVVPDESAWITQGASRCSQVEPLSHLAAVSHRLRFACTPPFDPQVAVRFQTGDGILGSAGEPLPPIDITVTLGDQSYIAVPSSLVPPPVPAELCAGEGCD
jgi:hypothetical protein